MSISGSTSAIRDNHKTPEIECETVPTHIHTQHFFGMRDVLAGPDVSCIDLGIDQSI